MRAIYRRFGTHPPVHWMVAAYLGIGKSASAAPNEQRTNVIDAFDLAMMMPGTGLSVEMLAAFG